MQWPRKPGHTLRRAQQLPAGTLRKQETSWSSATLVQTTHASWTPKQKQGDRLKCCVQYLAEMCTSRTIHSGTSWLRKVSYDYQAVQFPNCNTNSGNARPVVSINAASLNKCVLHIPTNMAHLSRARPQEVQSLHVRLRCYVGP